MFLLLEYYLTTWTGPLGTLWDMVHSQTEELKILINKYKKTISYQKQMTVSVRHDTDQTVKTVPGMGKTAKYHWYEIFMDCTPPATGTLHLRLKLRITVIFFCIVFFMHPELVLTSC